MEIAPKPLVVSADQCIIDNMKTENGTVAEKTNTTLPTTAAEKILSMKMALDDHKYQLIYHRAATKRLREGIKALRADARAEKQAAKASKMTARKAKQEERMKALDIRIERMLAKAEAMKQKAEAARAKKHSPKALKRAAKKASPVKFISKAA